MKEQSVSRQLNSIKSDNFKTCFPLSGASVQIRLQLADFLHYSGASFTIYLLAKSKGCLVTEWAISSGDLVLTMMGPLFDFLMPTAFTSSQLFFSNLPQLGFTASMQRLHQFCRESHAFVRCYIRCRGQEYFGFALAKRAASFFSRAFQSKQ